MDKITRKEIRRYLLREQGYEEDVVKGLPDKELWELWEHYHEY